jgi:hypothetical protein
MSKPALPETGFAQKREAMSVSGHHIALRNANQSSW